MNQGDEHRDSYRLQRARFERLASEVARRITNRLREQSILHFVTHRSKHPDDVAEKLARKRKEGSSKYSAPGLDLNSVMTDLAGVRVVVYEPEQESHAAQLVRSELALHEGELEEIFVVKPGHSKRGDGDGYRATHLLLAAPKDDPLVAGAICEVQVCNVVAHVFNELEHDIKYKHKLATPRPKTLDALEDVRALTRRLEFAVGALMRHHKRDIEEQQLEVNDAQELRQGLESVLGGTISGELELLFFLVRALFSPLTIHALRPLANREEGRRLCVARGIESPEDATALGLALLGDRVAEVRLLLVEWVREHPGSTGQLLDALNAWPTG